MRHWNSFIRVDSVNTLRFTVNTVTSIQLKWLICLQDQLKWQISIYTWDKAPFESVWPVRVTMKVIHKTVYDLDRFRFRFTSLVKYADLFIAYFTLDFNLTISRIGPRSDVIVSPTLIIPDDVLLVRGSLVQEQFRIDSLELYWLQWSDSVKIVAFCSKVIFEPRIIIFMKIYGILLIFSSKTIWLWVSSIVQGRLTVYLW